MIPKVIHYCWFGRAQMPELALKCIESWKKFLPEYEIKEWNEDNFDVNMISYTAEAYHAKKYAFVSDYARFWILYNYGGLYFDTDVEIIKPMDDIIAKGSFMGMEKTDGSTTMFNNQVLVNPGLGMGAYKAHPFYRDVLDIYKKKHFIAWTGVFTGTVVTLTTNLILRRTNIEKEQINEFEGIYIYPDEYFDPKNYYTGKTTITSNTRTIHKYSATWVSKSKKSYWKSICQRVSYIYIRLSVMFNI